MGTRGCEERGESFVSPWYDMYGTYLPFSLTIVRREVSVMAL